MAVSKLTHIGYPRIAKSKGLTVQIRRGDLSDPQIISLLERHLVRARAETAPGSAHALDLAGLQSPDISFWAAWDDGVLLGVGALKRLSPDHGEVKSMHTAESVRRRGIGAAVLRHLIAEARKCGLSRLSLETGSWEYFEPARAFYRRHGFIICSPFADYRPDPNSVFMTLELHHPYAVTP
jgi:putative acetyltransferase